MDDLINYEKTARVMVKRITALKLKKADIEKQLFYAVDNKMNFSSSELQKRLRDIDVSIKFNKDRLNRLYKEYVGEFESTKLHKFTSDTPVSGFVRSHSFWENLSKHINDKKAGNLHLSEDKFQKYVKGQFLEDKKMRKDTLYKIKTVDGKEVYGHFLTTDSQGMSVFEIKGQGGVIAAAADSFEKVLPYTIDVEYGNSDCHVNVKAYSYFAKAGQFEVGDVLITGDSFSIVRVCAIDTKSEKAHRHIKGYKVGTSTLIEQPEDDEALND